MKLETKEASRRVGAVLLSALVLIGATGGASAPKRCGMEMTRAASACDACVPHSTAESGPSLRAASCCHFEAPKDLTASPTITGSHQRSGHVTQTAATTWEGYSAAPIASRSLSSQLLARSTEPGTTPAILRL